MTEQLFDVVIAREFTDKNNKKGTAYTRVASGFTIKEGGIALEIEPGISISGRVLIFPRTEKPNASADAAPEDHATIG